MKSQILAVKSKRKEHLLLVIIILIQLHISAHFIALLRYLSQTTYCKFVLNGTAPYVPYAAG